MEFKDKLRTMRSIALGDKFMQAALELDGGHFPIFGNRTKRDEDMLSGAQLFRAHIINAIDALLADYPEPFESERARQRFKDCLRAVGIMTP